MCRSKASICRTPKRCARNISLLQAFGLAFCSKALGDSHDKGTFQGMDKNAMDLSKQLLVQETMLFFRRRICFFRNKYVSLYIPLNPPPFVFV